MPAFFAIGKYPVTKWNQMSNFLLIFPNDFKNFLCGYQFSQIDPKRKISQLSIFVKSIKIHKNLRKLVPKYFYFKVILLIKLTYLKQYFQIKVFDKEQVIGKWLQYYYYYYYYYYLYYYYNYCYCYYYYWFI